MEDTVLVILIVFLIILGFMVCSKENLISNKKKKKYDADDLTSYLKDKGMNIFTLNELKRKELNRDFNYEVPLHYKTPYQFLDFQDLIIFE